MCRLTMMCRLTYTIMCRLYFGLKESIYCDNILQWSHPWLTRLLLRMQLGLSQVAEAGYPAGTTWDPGLNVWITIKAHVIIPAAGMSVQLSWGLCYHMKWQAVFLLLLTIIILKYQTRPGPWFRHTINAMGWDTLRVVSLYIYMYINQSSESVWVKI